MSTDRRTGSAFRLVQISDCHLPASVETRYRGIHADDGLGLLTDRIASWQPQLMLVTGDLSEDGSAASYRRLATALERVGVPVCVLPGNHDDEKRMRHHFGQGPWNGPLVQTAGNWRLILLKSALPGRIDGAVKPGDIQSLRELLQSAPKVPVLLALHHHPVPAGAPWIDRHALESPGPLLKLIRENEQIRGVVWGHVHQAYEAKCGKTRMLACPSTAANSLPGTERFQHDPSGPACRWLKLGVRGRLETGLLFARPGG